MELIMIIFCIWMVIITSTVVANQNEVFIYAKQFCITNGSSAIAVNRQIDYVDARYSTKSTYKPSLPTDSNCNFEPNSENTCTKLIKDGWNIKNSINGPVLQSIITDRRWEDFPLFKSSEAYYGNKMYFNVLPITPQNFQIPFSVRIKQDAQIFLCDGDQPRVPKEANCYWIMIGSNYGKRAGIRKCSVGQISVRMDKYPGAPCKITHSLKNSSFHLGDVSELTWKHFSIERSQDTLQVYKSESQKPYLELKDGEFKPRHMFINSYNQQGLWKIHQYHYLSTFNEGTTRHSINVQNGQLCVDMFVAMCRSCRLDISFQNEYGMMVYNRELTFQVETWHEIRMVQNYIPSSFLQMVIKASSINYEPTAKFWAIDDIRVCQEPEYRYMEHSQNPCEELSIGNGRILRVNNTISTADIHCPEDTFGRMCLPCHIFYDQEYCPEMKYCEYVSNVHECHCSAGYHQKTTDEICTHCPVEYYGHKCRNRCSEGCSSTCDSISGQCLCKHPFQGARCNELPQPFLRYPPRSIEVTVDSCSFSIENDEIVGGNISNSDYLLQYRENGISTTWMSERYKSSYSRFTIAGLKSDTEYSIRVLIVGQSTQADTLIDQSLEKMIPKVTCKTKCNLLTPDKIKIDPGNTTASVKLEVGTNGCNIGRYSYLFNNQRNWVPGTQFDLACEPYTDYKIIFISEDKDIASIHFRTKEGVPSRVTDLKIYEGSSEYTRSLIWAKPEKKYGAVEYMVSYRMERRQCGYYGEYTNATTQSTEFKLRNLKPYSHYTGYVWATTKAGSGPVQDFQFDTVQLEKLTPKEMPKITKIVPENGIVTIQFEQIPCKDVKGPIIMFMSASCTNKWCTKVDNTSMDILNNQQANLSELHPFSEYTFAIKATRNGKVFEDADLKKIQTPATVPKKITSLDIVSTDETYITLRWKPPYPPTGIFEGYKIRLNNIIYGVDTWRNYEESKVTPCHLWKKYDCITLINLPEKIGYHRIQIHGKNQDPPEFVTLYELDVETKLSVPDPPGNLSYTTIRDKNEMYISWHHPIIMNGNLTKFDIIISGMKGQQIASEKIVDWKNYSMSYSYKVPLLKLEPCNTFTFNIRSHNRRYYSRSETLEFKTPPPPSSMSEDDIEVLKTNDTINIRLLKTTRDWNSLYGLLSNPGVEKDLDIFERKLRLGDKKLADPELVIQLENISKTSKIRSNHVLRVRPNQDYLVIFFLVSKCNDMVTVKRLSKHVLTQSSSASGLWAFLLLLLVPVVAYVYLKKLHPKLSTVWKSRDSSMSTTEQLPLKPTAVIEKDITTIIRTSKKQVSNTTADHSKRVRLEEFQQYVRSAIADGTLEKQIELFPKGLLKPHGYGLAAPNKSKNRYKNVIAYDHTRVKLKKLEDDEYSDYINANYIHGYKMPRVYIATQGPKACTLNDFWRMIWQETVKYIIMLANLNEDGKKKVEKYWPDINKTTVYGEISVEFISNKTFANYEKREFNIMLKDEKRAITQLHFISWPDHGIPLYPQSLVPFLETVLKISNNPRSPIVVHCSAGVGRTGTIILSDICLRMAASEGAIDFLSHLEQLRNQRPNLVDNDEQYKLAHLVVMECIFGMRTSIPCDADMDKVIKELLESDGVERQMRYIDEVEWQDRAMENNSEEMNTPVCDEKNRFPDIVPVNNRVYLTCHPPSDQKSSYINAVQVDGFRSPGRFLVTQLPLPNTVKDFWRLVCERETRVIIMIGTVDPSDKTICQFWPSQNSKISPVDFIHITCIARTSSEKSEQIKMKIHDSSRKIEFNVNMLVFNEWKNQNAVPANVEDLLSFLLAAENLSRNMQNVIVTCYDGVNASGLYIALSFLIEKMKLEHECDVCQAVRNIRHIRRQFISKQVFIA
ncbi:unnamed protein product [Acanthoscelides obtectus]|uniref:protein-tyrosine-phosphatase n=1 Tax=Acanthoscelides obtectus TaxID=200917 RepID=A0A9P0KMT2_ACAOB|nr:unnamed protein product [Acanthoscelides obtectus]CAK1667720.1 Receptor-type tyrosine-protein phosphatase kappa [Acanthoscelides obtectus]